MKFNKQGVRDLSTLAVTLIERGTNVTHKPHRVFACNTACLLDTRAGAMYQPLEPQPITCLTCLGEDGKDDLW